MEVIKKIAALLVLLSIFPLIRVVTKQLLLEPGNEIYSYIPQESDLVVEINTRNFITEISYQRIFNEAYFLEKMYPPQPEGEVEEPPTEEYEEEVENGLSLFSKIILFREQWANESVWLGVAKYTDEEAVKNFAKQQNPNAHVAFNAGFAILQLSPCATQNELTAHIDKIARKEVKAFTERVDLKAVFDPKKEINCYIIPKTGEYNQLIDGYLSFDFLNDHISIAGSFTPVSGFEKTPPVAYALNDTMALSIRSALNVFNSIYWFNQEKIEGIPDYEQLAFDYNGVDCYMINRDAGFNVPFKSFPKINLHFDVANQNTWTDFFDSLYAEKQILIDTTSMLLTTNHGALFNYDFAPHHFRLMQQPFTLKPSTDPSLYFALAIRFAPLLDGTHFMVDEENPPNALEQSLGMMLANQVLSDMYVLTLMESASFYLKAASENTIEAEGRIEMKDKSGHSTVESLSFGTTAFEILKQYM